jgi:hypothetical protein
MVKIGKEVEIMEFNFELEFKKAITDSIPQLEERANEISDKKPNGEELLADITLLSFEISTAVAQKVLEKYHNELMEYLIEKGVL